MSTQEDTKELTRAEIEAQRGIVRDEQGRIIRSKEWVQERIVHLETKKADLANRIQNIDKELALRQQELEGEEGKE
jgi:hypothetical protein